MRPIIFRAKRKDNGEWVEGDFVSNKYILQGYRVERGFVVPYNTFEVIPETVGQYTGLTDKHGKKIFEGDIVEEKSWLSWRRYYIKFYDGAFCHTTLKNYAMPLCDSEFGYALDGECYELEVIGNIHDNKLEDF